jgi:hypothetical protein
MVSIKGGRGDNAAIGEVNIGTIGSLSTVAGNASELLAAPSVIE